TVSVRSSFRRRSAPRAARRSAAGCPAERTATPLSSAADMSVDRLTAHAPLQSDLPRMLRKLLASQQAGLVIIIVLLGAILTAVAGTHVDRLTGLPVNNFLNSHTLIQVGTDASFFAIMAVGATIVIISGGIDLSVGSIYALAGVAMAMALRSADAGSSL